MRLTEAYAKVEWDVPMSWVPSSRGIGTSAHMLIELYLDMCQSTSTRFGRVDFLVEVLNKDQASGLRRGLEFIHEALNLDVDLERLRFFSKDSNLTRLRGLRLFSWALFCDHSVKETLWPEVGRNVGIYGLVRRFELAEDRARSGQDPWRGPGPIWRAYDRDSRFLGLLTEDGKREVMDMATCPITLGGASPTTYPATVLDSSISIRLRRAFDR